MIGFRGLLELVLGWLPSFQQSAVPACVDLAHEPATVITITHAARAIITIEDSCA